MYICAYVIAHVTKLKNNRSAQILKIRTEHKQLKWLICKQVGVMVHLLKCIFFSMKSGRFMTLIIYAAPLFPMSVTTADGSGLHDPSIYFGLARH